MTPYELRNQIRGGIPVFGTLIVSPSPKWPEVVADCDLDFIFIDTEHIAIDRSQLSWMCHAYNGIGLPTLVRIPSPDPYTATMVIDGGASGVIAPYVESATQVQQLRGAVKKRPLKGKKLEETLAGKPLQPSLDEYVSQSAENRLLIVNIESVPAMDALESILKVPDLDGVLIGPHDLTCSLAIPEQYDHPIFLDACESIFKMARKHGVGAGIHFWGDVEQQINFLHRGANMLIHSADISLFQKHLRAELAAIKSASGIQTDDTFKTTTVI